MGVQFKLVVVVVFSSARSDHFTFFNNLKITLLTTLDEARARTRLRLDHQRDLRNLPRLSSPSPTMSRKDDGVKRTEKLPDDQFPEFQLEDWTSNLVTEPAILKHLASVHAEFLPLFHAIKNDTITTVEEFKKWEKDLRNTLVSGITKSHPTLR
jgi:hypothetical protein